MDLEKEFKKETGHNAYTNNDLRRRIYTDYYVEWLEEKLSNSKNQVFLGSSKLRLIVQNGKHLVTYKGNILPCQVKSKITQDTEQSESKTAFAEITFLIDM